MEKTGVKADAFAGDGKVDDAIGLLNKMAQGNPARKEPWEKMAKIYFDAGDYGNAIVAAEEVLQRDKADRVAKGIRAVSGLRVATQSLNDLKDDNNLKGSARSDAISLVKTLRDALGEDVLVPAEDPKDNGDDKAAALTRRHAHARTYAPRKRAAPTTPASSTQPEANGDPFSVLR